MLLVLLLVSCRINKEYQRPELSMPESFPGAVAGDSISFHVISNDKGYQGLINHLELLGRSCKLVEPNVTRKVASKNQGRWRRLPA